MQLKDNAAELLNIITNWKTGYLKIGELSGNELTVIKAIVSTRRISGEDPSMSELADSINVGKSAMSQIIGRLEDKSIVERYMAKEDRRVVYVRLTAAGADLYNRFVARLSDFMERFALEMGEDDTKELIRLVHKSDEIFQQLKNSIDIDV